jgi:hypothetical protein
MTEPVLSKLSFDILPDSSHLSHMCIRHTNIEHGAHVKDVTKSEWSQRLLSVEMEVNLRKPLITNDKMCE